MSQYRAYEVVEVADKQYQGSVVEKNEAVFLINKKVVEGDPLKELDKLKLKNYNGPEAKNRIEQNCKMFVIIRKSLEDVRKLLGKSNYCP